MLNGGGKKAPSVMRALAEQSGVGMFQRRGRGRPEKIELAWLDQNGVAFALLGSLFQ